MWPRVCYIRYRLKEQRVREQDRSLDNDVLKTKIETDVPTTVRELAVQVAVSRSNRYLGATKNIEFRTSLPHTFTTI